MPEGFTVDVDALDAYARELTGDMDLVTEVSGLVAQSDVGDESWGIVGLFVKSTYTGMLGDLNDLLGDMKDGLESGAEKITACAETYRTIEKDTADVFNDVLGDLDEIRDAFKDAVTDAVRDAVKDGVREGIEEGIREGVKEGIQEGIREGIEEGIEDAIEEGLGNGADAHR